MSVSVISTTGQRVDFSMVSDNDLAAMLDKLDEEKRLIGEQRALVTREMAKRMGDRQRLTTDEFDVTQQRYVNVSRRTQGKYRGPEAA